MTLIRDRVQGGAPARSVVATAEIMALAAAAHTVAGGELPSASWLTLTSAGVLVASLGCLRGAIRVRTAALTIGALQIGLHFAFQATAQTGASGMAAQMGHAMQTGHAGAGLHLGGAMLAAHLVSAVSAAVLLTVQERALARVRRWFRALRVPPQLVTPTTGTQPVPATPRGMPAHRILLLIAPLRGPPAPLAVAP